MNRRIKVFVIILMLVTAGFIAGDTQKQDQNQHAEQAQHPEQTPHSEEGEHSGQGKHDEHGFSWTQFLGKIVNSTILFGGLFFLARKPLIELLSKKSLDIKNDIIQREKQVESTTVELGKIQERLERIEKEILDMKKNAEISGNDEKKRLEELAEQEKQRIKKMTEEEIDTRVENAVRNLKERVADLTIDHFRKDIQAHLDENAHDKIIEKNIQISGDIIERE